MASINTHATKFPTLPDIKLGEGYMLSNNKLLIFSETFEYILYNMITKSPEIQAQFPEKIPELYVKLTNQYTHWLCHYKDDIILYYSVLDKCIKEFDLTNPLEKPKNWSATPVIVDVVYIQNFIWIHYNPRYNTVHL